MASRTRTRNRNRRRDGGAAGREPGRDPVPAGWPGDDPTLPEEVSALAGRPPRPGGETAEGVETVDTAEGVEGVQGVVDEPGRSARERHRRERGGLVVDHHGRDREVVRERDQRGARHDGPDDDTDLDQPHGEELSDDELDLIAGVQPAGRVLVVLVATLVLAMLVNADALVARAERRPAGPERDRALAIWHPVQDVSHVLQLYRVRQVADWLAGDDDEPADAPRTDRESRQAPSDASRAAAGDAPDDGAADPADPGGDEAAFTLRTPSADEPLRLLVAGDFTAQVVGDSLARAAAATEVADAEVHVESASGLTRQDYFDWPDALDRDVADLEAEVVVVVLGVNDAQGIVLDDGTPAQLDDPRWAEEYHRRVGDLMDQLRADDRMVVWLGQPPMRDADFGARMAALNQIYAAEAADRPWVAFVDPAAVVGGPGGAYADAGTDQAGAPVELRQADGIHLTPAAGDLIATHVLDLVGEHVDLAPDADGAEDPAAG